MSDLLLLHWNSDEAEERAERLRGWGHEVRTLSAGGADALRAFVEDPPSVTLIDLGRLPSQGREVGIYLRRRKATRRVPLVFIDGRDDKVAQTKKQLPDAFYTT